MMSKPADALREPAIDIRFGQIGLVQVRIHTTDPGAILDELTGRIATAPRFFQRTAVCLDLSALQKEPDVAEVRAVLDAVRRAGMLSVGLTHGTAAVDAISAALDIPVLTHFRPQSHAVPVVGQAPPADLPTLTLSQTQAASLATPAAPGSQPATDAAAPPSRPMRVVRKAAPAAPVEAPEVGLPALMHHQPVRSGQRVYARQRDLIVTATVGAGAEVMADGCVHIYGSLRGRAMAGARGDLNARVFCQEFNAELVSIAGVFRVFETLPAELAGKPVQAWLDGDDLRFARIGIDSPRST